MGGESFQAFQTRLEPVEVSVDSLAPDLPWPSVPRSGVLMPNPKVGHILVASVPTGIFCEMQPR